MGHKGDPLKSKPKYKRTVIFENKDVEVILIDWEPGSETPIHDHGKSHGLVRVLRGSLTEELFSIFTLEKFYSEIYKKGSVALELPQNIHRMINAGKISAQSLHIYTPPLVMREYKERRKKK